MKAILLFLLPFLISAPAMGADLLDVRQKREITRALLLESREDYLAAMELWSEMPGEGAKLNHRAYVNLLKLGKKPIPETNQDAELGFRYAIWQKDLKEIHYLRKRPFLDLNDDSLRLQMAFAALMEQDYSNALQYLTGSAFTENENQQQRDLLLVATYVLQGKPKLAQRPYLRYQESSLYTYPGVVAPLIRQGDATPWERGAMRYQADKYVEEQLFLSYLRIQKKDWKSWRLPAKGIWWKGYPRLASLHLSFQEALEFLGSKASGPDDFNRWVEYLDQGNQRTKLKQLCLLWQERYPFLEDGKLCMQLVTGL